MDKTSNPSPAAKDLQAGYQTLRPGTQDLPSKPFRLLLLLPLLFLGGCNMIVMNPAGDVASRQANLILSLIHI